jgi:hypothetical protein
MIFTDLCYLTSVLVNGIDKDLYGIIIQNSPWLFSCSISLISGIIILTQFEIYKYHQYVEIVENVE